MNPPFVKPMSPSEVLANKVHVLPPEVIRAVNQLLTERFDGHQARFNQEEIVNKIIYMFADLDTNGRGGSVNCTKEKIYEKHWLDFEPIYRQEGWVVEYDNPGYNESYTPNWKFRKSMDNE